MLQSNRAAAAIIPLYGLGVMSLSDVCVYPDSAQSVPGVCQVVLWLGKHPQFWECEALKWALPPLTHTHTHTQRNAPQSSN